ncbi:amidohydrolase family protein [Rhodococcus sp. 2H158]
MERAVPAEDLLAIRARRAFDGGRTLPDGALVLCRDGRIIGVEPATCAPPVGWQLHDYPGATVLPGLVDCHVHLCGDSRNGALDRLPGLADDELDAIIDRSLADQLAAGVTTVRDLGDRHWAVVDRRDRLVQESPARCPTVVAAGPPITTHQGHCWHMGGAAERPDEIRAAIHDRADRRVDIVKVMASGGTMTAGTDVLTCQYRLDQLRLVVDESHAVGLPVTAHAHGLPAVRQAIAAGVDGLEHCSCFTEHRIDLPESVLRQLAGSRIAVCPTLGKRPDVTLPPAVLALQQKTGTTWEARQALAGRLCNAGVDVVSGVDAGISDGKAHGILALAVADLVIGGADITTALTTATSRAAHACGLSDRKGALRAGYDADLLVVDGDATIDIHALQRIRAVYLHGTLAATPR